MNKQNARKFLGNGIAIVVVSLFIIPAVIYQAWWIAGIATVAGGFAVYKAWQK